MQNTGMSPFQIVLIGIFVLLGLVGIAVFAMYKGGGGEANPYGRSVVIWGTLDDGPMIQMLTALKDADSNASVVSYQEKDPRTFSEELLNALAEGRGPDIVLLPSDELLSYKAKLYPIPYESYPQRTFQDTYIDGADIFMMSDGIYAYPVAVDPLMLYWNKSIFASSGFVRAPSTWSELTRMFGSIINRDFSHKVTRAVVAFGDFVSVKNAKHIIALLMMQAGSNMVSVDSRGLTRAELNMSRVGASEPGSSAVSFFMQFSNPQNEYYTWNRAMRSDRDFFLAGDLAMYFGFASELQSIREGNPNLAFDVAPIPQNSDNGNKLGYGRFYGYAILRNSKNVSGAWMVLPALASAARTQPLASAYGFADAHDASYPVNSSDPYAVMIGRAALVSRAWLDPDPEQSDSAFRIMVEDAASGRSSASTAVRDAEDRLLR